MTSKTIQSLTPYLNQSISFAHLELILLDLPQKIVFRSGIGIRKSRQALIVKWLDRNGAIGYGECSCRPDPYYSDEFIAASFLLIQNFIIPHLSACHTYRDVLNLLEKIRGWPFTKAAVEFALHDLIYRKTGKMMFDFWERERLEKVPVGISLGIQESWETLRKNIEESKAQNYHRLKFKISPKVELAHFRKLQQQTQRAYISFDANGTYYPRDLEHLKVFADFGNMIEQPFPPGRIDIFQQAKKEIPHLIVCLDEEVKTLGNLITAHQLHALDELNLKLGRVGGLYKSILIADYCLNHDIPCWIGGMFETGIGRSLNLRFASFLPKAKAHDLSPSSRYFVEDVLENPIDMDGAGFISLDELDDEISEDILRKYAIRWE